MVIRNTTLFMYLSLALVLTGSLKANPDPWSTPPQWDTEISSGLGNLSFDIAIPYSNGRPVYGNPPNYEYAIGVIQEGGFYYWVMQDMLGGGQMVASSEPYSSQAEVPSIDQSGGWYKPDDPFMAGSGGESITSPNGDPPNNGTGTNIDLTQLEDNTAIIITRSPIPPPPIAIPLRPIPRLSSIFELFR